MALIDKETIRAEIERLVKNNDSLTEQPVEGLEEAAREYAKEYTKNEGNGGDDWEDDIQITFKAAAEWQKAKMLEGAVEGYVGYYEDNLNSGILVVEAEVGHPYHNGDKVRVIVIKEDEK